MKNEEMEKNNILYNEDVKVDGKNYKFVLTEKCIIFKKKKGIFNKKLITVKSINIKDIETLKENSRKPELTLTEKNNENKIKIVFNDFSISSKIKNDINKVRYSSFELDDAVDFVICAVTFCIKHKKEIKSFFKKLSSLINKLKKRK